YQTATFALSLKAPNQYDYTRSGNPTRTIAEQQAACLEEGAHGFTFSSGMAALTAVFGLLSQGDHIITGVDLYGGTHRLLVHRLSQRSLSYTAINTTDLSTVAGAIRPETRLVFIETPSNPLLKISDIEALAKLAHQHGILLAVDNSFLSPCLQQHLLLSADIVIHSA